MKLLYRARTKEGKSQKGVIEASSRKAALGILEKYGLYVTSLKEAGKRGILSMKIGLFQRVSQQELISFTRQLATMMKSAIPPLEALRAQLMQTTSTNFREKILKMAESIETGNTFSQAFAIYPKVFDPFYVSIIKAGEATGKVSDSLTYLAEHLERQYNFNQKVKGAMLYPAFVIAVFIASFSVVIFFIVPRLSEILKTFKGDLPWMTRLLIWSADFISKGGWVVVPILLVPLAILPFYLRRSRNFKLVFDRFSLKLPILGEFYKKIYLTRFAENFSILLAAGLPITQSIKITRGIMSNSLYKKILRKAEERVSKGERISETLNQYPKLFPAFVTQMVFTGEETGKLDKILQDMVEFYRQEIERTAEKLSTVLEPILIIILGIGIAILAFAVFIPLFKIGVGGIGT